MFAVADAPVRVRHSLFRDSLPLFAAVFLLVLIVQLALVAVAGTDIPFHDQWNVEGRWLYPAARERTLAIADYLQAHNEHRITWTHVLNIVLFSANGQWDPIVQLVAVAFLRASCVAGLACGVAKSLSRIGQWVVATVAIIAFLPHLAWHGVLWGFESQIYFSIGLVLLTFALLVGESLSGRRAVAGILAALAALVAMGPAALAPFALFGLAGLRWIERRRIDPSLGRLLLCTMILMVPAALLRVEVPDHIGLRANGIRQFFEAAVRVLGWPHTSSPFAVVAMNFPILIAVGTRLLKRRMVRREEDFVLLVGGWSAAIGLATAWARGGSWELSSGVPSRYVDFIILLPLANCWAAVVLAQEAAQKWKSSARILTAAWCMFAFVGWLGLSASVMRGIVIPRARDREAPIRVIRAYQVSGDAAVFQGQPRLLVPHPNAEVVREVLRDPRLKGALPPSLQPEEPMGPLSRTARALLGQTKE